MCIYILTEDQLSTSTEIVLSDYSDKLRVGQHYFTFVSLHIPQKSFEIILNLEPIIMYIYKDHGGTRGHQI